MVDLSKTIEPSSQQLNADDLIAGPRTIKITKVSSVSGDQPILIHYEGEDGRPYKPCKSMRRLLVKMWGKDGDKYAGRALTLFCDPTVTFGPDAVGGIRISHMSHIERDETMMLTVSRGKKKPYQVRRLQTPVSQFTQMLDAINGASELSELEAMVPRLKEIPEKKTLPPAEYKALQAAYKKRLAALQAPSDDYGEDESTEEPMREMGED